MRNVPAISRRTMTSAVTIVVSRAIADAGRSAKAREACIVQPGDPPNPHRQLRHQGIYWHCLGSNSGPPSVRSEARRPIKFLSWITISTQIRRARSHARRSSDARWSGHILRAICRSSGPTTSAYIAVVFRLEWPSHFWTRVSGTPAKTAETANPCRNPRGEAWSPTTRAPAITFFTRRHANVRPKDHSGALGSFLLWRSSSSLTSSAGTGISRTTTLPRFFSDRMATKSVPAWTDETVSDSASDIRQPVYASVMQSVWVSRSSLAAASRNARLSSGLRYLRRPSAA